MKKIICLIISIISILSLCACGNKEEAISALNIDALTSALLSGLEFEAKPEEVDGMVALSDYAIDESLVNDARYFRVGSAVADELAVFEAVDSENTAVIEAAISDRLQYLLEGFSDYKPSEVPKIKNAYTKTIGNIVFLVICKDTSKIDDILKSI